ncbi:MAG: hypothetical protein ACO3FH_11900 [Steroidobacteraceae bacterium]
MLFPEIDENVPLPANAAEALPDLSPQEELNARARTIKFLSDLTGTPIVPDQDDIEGAKQLATQMMADPQKRIDYSKYPNEMMAYLAGMVAQTNCALVDDLSELKLYVVNKLVYEIEHAKDSRSRIQALTKLGEVDGIDAFKKRTEMTLQVKPIEEVEKELLTVLEGIEYKVLDVKDAPTDA